MLVICQFPVVIEQPALDEAHIDSELDSVYADIERLRKARTELGERLDALATQYRIFFPHEFEDLGEVDNAVLDAQEEMAALAKASEPEDSEVEEPAAEVKDPEAGEQERKRKKERKKDIKMVYRRISALCHPDKTLGLIPSVIKELRALFVEAKAAFLSDNLGQLLEIYAIAGSIHRGKNDTERAELKAERLSALRRNLSYLLSDISAIQNGAMFAVYRAHEGGQTDEAQYIYREILNGHLHRRKAILAELLAVLKNIKKANAHG